MSVMKKILWLLILLIAFQTLRAGFDDFFLKQSLRVDYYHSGNAGSEFFSLKTLLHEPFWGGSLNQLVDTMNFGNHKVEVYDLAEGKLIYSRGYSSLFTEWQTTAEAKLVIKTFEESALIPFPKNPVLFRICSRDSTGVFTNRFEMKINPNDYFIRPAGSQKWPVADIHISGDPATSVDIVVIPDGFRASEMDLFLQKASDFARYLFQFEPYAGHSNKFNIRAVLAVSDSSGVAVPAEGFWPETVVSSSFYTFDSERYCMTTAHHRLRDIAALAPYDQIYILTNTTKYGGGGIFNFYCLSSALNQSSPEIIVHEFGHGFAGLADEYYDSSTSYESFYELTLEPWEPNITTLVDFASKWQDLLKPETPIPTPDSAEWEGVTAVFEGGGYTAKGMYRPSRDCLMHTFKGKVFCAACNRAIERMIDFYTK
mgnify:FL=1